MEELTLSQAIDQLKLMRKNLTRNWTTHSEQTIAFKRKSIKAIDRILEEIELTRDDGKLR